MAQSNRKLIGGIAAVVLCWLASSATGTDASPENAGAGAGNKNKQSGNYMDGFDCGTGKAGWKRAKAVTPNLVGPCNSGSGGMCESPSFQYVPGTGWCRPR